MRESNNKTWMKNILDYKKPEFWPIVGTLIVLLAFSAWLPSNTVDNKPKPESEARAEEFLNIYYTINNTDIADLFYDFPLVQPMKGIDSDGHGIVEVPGIEEALKAKYGEFMTEKGLEVAASNRVIPQGEMAAREYGSTMEVEYVNIRDMRISDYGSISYNYSIVGLVKFNDGSEELVTLIGSLLMREVEGIWKVDRFNPDRNELEKVLQYGQSYLILTYESDFSTIRSIELIRKDNFQHATMYVNGSLEGTKNEYVTQMRHIPFVGNIDFTIKVLDKDNIVLAEKEFAKDFSNGKDVELFVREDENEQLIISDKSTLEN